jgi:hypothetical protein
MSTVETLLGYAFCVWAILFGTLFVGGWAYELFFDIVRKTWHTAAATPAKRRRKKQEQRRKELKRAKRRDKNIRKLERELGISE